MLVLVSTQVKAVMSGSDCMSRIAMSDSRVLVSRREVLSGVRQHFEQSRILPTRSEEWRRSIRRRSVINEKSSFK